jgi:cytoskeletal protein CcmA (bactofilin family)
MASTYVNDLRLNEMATGDQSGAWGTVTNTNLELIGDAFGYATEAITTNADTHATIIADGAADAGRAMVLKYTGTLDSACTITISGGDASTFTVSKLWYIHNATSGSQNIIITSGSGANITIANGQTKCVYTDGAGSGGAVIDTFAALSVVDLFVDDDLTVTDDLTVGGDIDLEGSIDVNGTTNLDVVDIDGAVNMATTALVTGVLTTTAATVFNGGFASNADSLVGTDKKIKFRDAAIYINSSTDGQLDIVADTEIQIAATTIDINGAINASGEIIAASLDISGNADIDGTLETDGLTVGGVAAKVAGKESIYVPAAAMYPSTTNPCSDLTQVETTALRPDLKVLDFAAAADDFAQFTIAFPKSWNEGTITFQPFWTVTGTDAGTVAWQLAAVAITSDESINTAFGTQVATTALAFSTTSNDLMVSVESGAVTIAGSPAANDMCFFQINRDTSADTQSGAARLIGIKIFFTTDAANDA